MNVIVDILKNNKPYIDLMELYKSGELRIIFPELYNLYSDEKGYKNNFLHTLDVLKNVCNFNNDFKMKLVAVLHDIGKEKTKRLTANGYTFHEHERVGAEMSIDILKKWGITDKKLINYVYRMILFHGRTKIHRDVTESAIRRLDNEVGKDVIFDLIDFCKLDLTTKYEYKKQRIISSLDTIKDRIIEIRNKDEESKWRSPLTGHVIMELLDVGQGRIIGDIKKELDPLLKKGEMDLEQAIEYINKNKKKWLN
jgi:poly(A) polymerase